MHVTVFSFGISSSPYILNYFIKEKLYFEILWRPYPLKLIGNEGVVNNFEKASFLETLSNLNIINFNF